MKRSFSFLIILCSVVLPLQIYAGSTADIDLRQKKVQLREVGHKLLLSMGDSTSHVMPIEVDGARYKISFDTEVGFLPDSLDKIVNAVVSGRGIASKYMVEVQGCNEGPVVYGYVVDPSDEHLLPCGGRDIKKGCYEIFFTDFEDEIFLATVPPSLSDLNRASMIKKISAFLLLFGLAFFIFLKRPQDKKVIESKTVGKSIGNYAFDPNGMRLTIDGNVTELTSKEATLLALLHDHKNETVKREDLLSHVWGDEGDYVGRTLDVFISKLRKKIALDPSLKIVNTRGVGYRLTQVME